MRFKLVLLAILSLGITSCCKEDDKVASEVIKVDPEQLSQFNCETPPEPVMCCQAMTPACNDCREKSRLDMEEFRRNCSGDKSLPQIP